MSIAAMTVTETRPVTHNPKASEPCQKKDDSQNDYVDKLRLLHRRLEDIMEEEVRVRSEIRRIEGLILKDRNKF